MNPSTLREDAGERKAERRETEEGTRTQACRRVSTCDSAHVRTCARLHHELRAASHAQAAGQSPSPSCACRFLTPVRTRARARERMAESTHHNKVDTAVVGHADLAVSVGEEKTEAEITGP